MGISWKLSDSIVVSPLSMKKRVGVLAEPGAVAGTGGAAWACFVERVRRHVRRK